jgi:hypothetical protein
MKNNNNKSKIGEKVSYIVDLIISTLWFIKKTIQYTCLIGI